MRAAKHGALGIIMMVVTLLTVFMVSGVLAQEVIKVVAKRFEYSPAEITLKKGVPVVLEFTSTDKLHGFNCPGLGVRTDIEPGKANRLELTPQKAGTFPFHCDNFCGTGHDKMKGTIIVTE
jgi:cytochrome c oxidase subunit II